MGYEVKVKDQDCIFDDLEIEVSNASGSQRSSATLANLFQNYNPCRVVKFGEKYSENCAVLGQDRDRIVNQLCRTDLYCL